MSKRWKDGNPWFGHLTPHGSDRTPQLCQWPGCVAPTDCWRVLSRQVNYFCSRPHHGRGDTSPGGAALFHNTCVTPAVLIRRELLSSAHLESTPAWLCAVSCLSETRCHKLKLKTALRSKQCDRPGGFLKMWKCLSSFIIMYKNWLFRKRSYFICDKVLQFTGPGIWWGSLVGCRLWGRRVGHNWSDLAAASNVRVF